MKRPLKRLCVTLHNVVVKVNSLFTDRSSINIFYKDLFWDIIFCLTYNVYRANITETNNTETHNTEANTHNDRAKAETE